MRRDDFYGEAFTVTQLTAAWQQVLDNDLADKRLSWGVTKFRDDQDRRINNLASKLEERQWAPNKPKRVEIPKSSGGVRVLHIPSVADRVVERAAQDWLRRQVDWRFNPGCVAYRPGLGTQTAVRRLVALREEGLRWVLRTDVADYFPSIRRSIAVRAFADFGFDGEVLDFIDLFTNRRLEKRSPIGVGIPQGSPLSPLLANIVLTSLDDDLTAEGFPFVRYGDDLCVVGSTEKDATRALTVLRRATHRLKLKLGEGDTAVTNFDDGFWFVGEEFGPRYPDAATTRERVELTTKTLFVGKQYSRLQLRSGRVRVLNEDAEPLLDEPREHLGRIVLAGQVSLPAGTRTQLLYHQIPVVLLSRRGRYMGVITTEGSQSAPLLRAQLDLSEDTARALELSQSLVQGKVRLQRTHLQRLGRRDTASELDAAVQSLMSLLTLIPDVEGMDALRGIEGMSSRIYFDAIGRSLPDGFDWSGRSRRPPADVTNSALSYGYAVLLGEVVTALHIVGLEPSLGVLHSDRTDRPSLGLDLMEEFRPLIVDNVVISLIRRRELRPEHGRRDDDSGGVLLTEAGRRILLGGIESRLLTRALHTPSGTKTTFRRMITLQAYQIKTIVEGHDVGYDALGWR